jgi:hypothetical protein
MVSIFPDDVLSPAGSGPPERRSRRTSLVAFVPITIAIIGVATILVGRVTVSEIAQSEFLGGVDPITTGSIEAVPLLEQDAEPGGR